MSKLIQVFRMVAHIVLPLLILSVGVGGMYAFYISKRSPDKKDRSAKVPRIEVARITGVEDPLVADEVRGATVEPAGSDEFRYGIYTDGFVVPHRQIQLAAEITGKVKSKTGACEVGRFVNKGDVLFTIDSEEAIIEFDRLTEEMNQADLSLEELHVERASLEKILKLQEEDLALQLKEKVRAENLKKSGAGTTSAIDRALKNVIVAENARLSTESQLNVLASKAATLASTKQLVKKRRDRAQLDKDRAVVTAPFAGMIVEEHVETDSFIQRGSVMVTMEDTKQSEIRCNLRMDELYWIWAQVDDSAQQGADNSEAAALGGIAHELPETPVEVTYEINGTKYRWDGVLNRYDGLGLDEKTRTVPCRIDVLEPVGKIATEHGGKLASENSPLARSPSTGPPSTEPSTLTLVRGMYVNLRIKVRPMEAMLRLPENAIRPGDEVFKATEVTNATLSDELRPAFETAEIELADIEFENQAKADEAEAAYGTSKSAKSGSKAKPIQYGSDHYYYLTRHKVRIVCIHEGFAVVLPDSGSDLMPGDKVVTSALSSETDGSIAVESRQHTFPATGTEAAENQAAKDVDESIQSVGRDS